jgi:serine/threonine-protein kinase
MTPLEVGGVVASKYRLVRPLAKGGMGSVWVARHVQLDVDVAVKFMAPTYAESADARARFEREAKAAAQLKSPNVVQVHDYGIADGIPYLVMELLQGEDLGERLRRERRLSLPAVAAVLVPVCRALRRAHDAGIVHRDLKPGNIFLARQDDEESVKVLDFGVAKVTDPGSGASATKDGSLVGSPNYMSPEQVRAKRVDHRSDLWSMGVVLFEAVTGQLPFPGDDVGDVLVEVCTAPIPVPSQVARDLRPEVDRFFERALARDPAARFQSARELAEAFTALAGAQDGAAEYRLSLPSAPVATASSAVAPISSAPWKTASPAVPAGFTVPMPRASAGHDGGPPPGPASASQWGLGSQTPGPRAPVPGNDRRNAMVLGLAGSVLVVGILLASILHGRAPAPSASAAPPSAEPAPVPSPPAHLDPANPPAGPAPAPSASVAVEAPSVPVPAPSPSVIAPVRSPGPARGGLPGKPRKPTHDPLDRL